MACAQSDWSTAVDIDNSYQRFSGSPSMAIDANGFVHAAWGDWEGNNKKIRYATNMSGSWIKNDVQSYGATPCLVLTSDQTLYLFYDDGNPTHCFVRSKAVGGGSWSAATQLTGTDGGNLGWAAVDGSGGIYFVWVKIRFDPNHGENYGRYKPLGGAWGSTELIRNSSNGWPTSNWVSAQGNRFYISYYTSDDKPWMKVRDNGVLGPERTLAGSGLVPRVVENPRTGVLEAIYHSDWKNWFVQSFDGGAIWSTPMVLSTGSYLDRNPLLIADDNGNVHVLWQKIHSEGGDSMCYYRQRVNGAWQTQYELTPWALQTSGPSAGSLVVSRDASNVYIHALPISDYSTDDYGDAVYLKRTESYVAVGPNGRLSGAVRDQYGQAVAGAAVVTNPLGYAAISNASGTYSIAGLPVDTYSVTASKQYFAGQTVSGVVIVASQTTARDFVLTGQSPLDVGSLALAEGDRSNTLSWVYPDSANLTGFMLRYKTTGYPSSASDGTLLTDRAASRWASDSFAHTGLANGTIYYYRAFTYYVDASRYYSSGLTIAGTPAGPGDLDRDGDVDQADYGLFQACLSGPYVEQADPNCRRARLDGDADVDVDDLGLFVGCISGPAAPASPNCLN